MGAFFLHHKTTRFSETFLEQHFNKARFKDPLIVDLYEYKLYLFKKQLSSIDNHFHIGVYYIYVCGSLFYKGLSYRKSLEKLLNDYFESNIEWDELFGNYFLIFYNQDNKNIDLFFDPAFIKAIYVDFEKKIISSSFLAIKAASAQSYNLNQEAVIENLVTGHLISPDTYLKEITRIDKANISEITNRFDKITAGHHQPKIPDTFKSKEDAIHHANDILSEYFNRISHLANEFGASIGLTGGFDSRLLLMHAKNKIDNLILNSFWRPDSKDFILAKSLATATKLKFYSYENVHFRLPNFDEQLELSCLFFDGQIRSQNFWSEEFNHPDYSRNIISNHLIGFHGCGGEQYRNADRLINSIDLRKYIKYDWISKQGGAVFRNNFLETIIIDHIEKKIKRLIEIPNNRIHLRELKKIQNEIWNVANRTTRLNALNQQLFYFAPFTEYIISHTAYNYTSYLGNSLNFQIEMMKQIDPYLSEVPTIYGYNILEGETILNRILPIIYNIVPRKFSNLLLLKTKKVFTNQSYSKFSNNDNNALTDLVGNIIDLSRLQKNSILGKNIDPFIYLLNTVLN